MGGEELPLAPVGKRFGALLVDWLIFAAAIYGSFVVLFVVLVVGSIDVEDPNAEPDFRVSARVFVALLVALSFGWLLIQWSLDTFGWSPGKAATSVRTVRLDGRRPGVVHGLVRYSMRTVSFLALGLGYLWALWDERNQTWHDKLAGTVVVRAQPLQEQIPDRRPEPLVTQTRVWWLAAIATVLLTASMALTVWWLNSIDGDLFDSDFNSPRFGDEQRAFDLERPAGVDLELVTLED